MRNAARASRSEAMGGLTARLRRAPLGIVVIAAILVIAGAGSVAAGVFMLLRGDPLSLWAGSISILVGPAMLHLAHGLVGLARWTWLALFILIALLFLSSVARVVMAPGLPIAAVGEMLVEVIAAAYLTRPRLRSLFGG